MDFRAKCTSGDCTGLSGYAYLYPSEKYGLCIIHVPYVIWYVTCIFPLNSAVSVTEFGVCQQYFPHKRVYPVHRMATGTNCGTISSEDKVVNKEDMHLIC